MDGQIKNSKQHQGGLKRRFKDVIEEHLKVTNIDHTSWEGIARDRAKQRAAVQSGVRTAETNRIINKHEVLQGNP